MGLHSLLPCPGRYYLRLAMTARLAVVTGSALLLVQLVCGRAVADETTRDPVAPRSVQGERPEGRPELLFLDAELGAAYLDMVALKDSALLEPLQVESEGAGPMYGAAVGLRRRELWVAASYRDRSVSNWHLWTLGAEAGIKFSIARFAPHVSFGAGYASLGGLVTDISHAATRDPAPAVDIHGLNVRLKVGLDYYLWRWLSVGTSVSAEAFFLRREGDGLVRTSTTDPNSRPDGFQALDGSGNGLGSALSAVLGFHY